MEGQGIEFYDMPEHGPEGAASDWPVPTAPPGDNLGPNANFSVAAEIDRLLDAARVALEQVPSGTLAPSENEFHWPEWSEGVAVCSADDSPATADHATVRIIIGRFCLSPDELACFRGGQAVHWGAAASGLVEIHAGGRLRARGTLLVMDDRFGVRITELVASAARAGSH